MPRTTTLHAVTAIGIDMGKNTLHLIGLDARGAIVLREKVARGRIALRQRTGCDMRCVPMRRSPSA
jgi:transposase